MYKANQEFDLLFPRLILPSLWVLPPKVWFTIKIIHQGLEKVLFHCQILSNISWREKL